MRQTELFTKTIKEIPRDEESRNAELLIRAGYIQKEMAGVYVFLPLGYRVLNKIVEIIRQEIDAIGGQEIYLSALQNPENWKSTDRWSDKNFDVWFKTKLANGSEVGLGATHEEPLTVLMKNYIHSYKDLPRYVYQFQVKFRNELRAKAGLLRTREFLMKDLYSFDTSQKELDNFYETAKQAYYKIFERIGIGQETFLTFASGGAFSKYSHEFQTVCKNGEDTIYLNRKKKIAINKEVYNDAVLKELGLKKSEMTQETAIEVGNIFKLGTRFSEPLGLKFTDQSGKLLPVVMGSYGIGPTRVMATTAELLSDDKGLVWPEAIAPFTVHLVQLGAEKPVAKAAEKAYQELLRAEVEVLFDDRSEISAGQKFAEADLIGLPYRIVISPKTGSQVELKSRISTKAELLSLDKAVKKIK